MLHTLTDLVRSRDGQMVAVAGVAGFAVSLVATQAVDAHLLALTAPCVVLAAVTGALLAVCVAGAVSTGRVRRKLSEQKVLLEDALNNMVVGLCMFDAQNRLLVWNERYQTMYNIDPKRIWRGCTIRDLLDARIAAGTFPLDPARYDAELRAHLKKRQTFTLTIELADGRIIAVVNQPMQSGGWVATHEDITARKRVEHERDRTRIFLDTIIDNIPSNIVVKELPSMRYVLVNRAGEKQFDLPREQVIGKTADEIFPKDSADVIMRHDREVLQSCREVFAAEHVIVTPAGRPLIVASTRLPVMGDDGKPQYLIAVVDDLTERKRDEQRIAHMQRHDPLTGLPNRAAFNECIAATVALAERSGEGFALLSLDLEGLTEVNDVFGQTAGDVLLREVAVRLESACAGAFIARIGGDEFAVITPSGPQPATAESLAEQLSTALDDDIDIGPAAVRAASAIGVSIFPQDGGEPPTLIANADAALFRAKTDKRGSIYFFDPSMDQELRERRALQQELRIAIAREELVLHYQPYTKISGDVVGFEALVRWKHPTRGMIPPAQFIPLAEESGLIVPLSEWILRTACREAAAWPHPLRISVNLSPVQFRLGDLVRLVHSILLETGLAPGRLKLEVTEGVLIDDYARGLSILRRLKSLGVRIAMDDFGSGYSSLSYLQAFPFDKIKIDKSFIANLPHNQQSAAIVRAVIGLAHGLDLPVVAEGVETPEQRQFLAGEGCDEVQGFLIGRPKPIEGYAAQVGRRRPSRKKLATVS